MLLVRLFYVSTLFYVRGVGEGDFFARQPKNKRVENKNEQTTELKGGEKKKRKKREKVSS